MKLRDTSYNPPLRMSYEMPSVDYFAVDWKRETWFLDIQIQYCEIPSTIEWLDANVGNEWDFPELPVPYGIPWVEEHNSKRMELYNNTKTIIKQGRGDMGVSLTVVIANPRAAVLAKLKFDTHKRYLQV